jgi:RNA polymerase sigma-70 factor, ECF subfamily
VRCATLARVLTAPHLPLSTAFTHARARGDAPAPELLEPLLAQLVSRARARWPDLEVDPVDFVRHLAGHLPPDAPALETVAAEDLYLALGCLRADARALAAFERTHLREVGAFVAHLDRSPAFADEVRQALRERLFTGKARIAEYSGAGALGGWVRVAALRTALNLRRTAERAESHAQRSVEEALGVSLGPELGYLKAHYREAFSEALRASVESLTDRERALLRLCHLEGLSLEAIAAVYRVHLSTVSRWLTRARAQVAEGTRARGQVAEGTTRHLRERLGLGASEADSLAALVLSQLDLSLARLLRGPG